MKSGGGVVRAGGRMRALAGLAPIATALAALACAAPSVTRVEMCAPPAERPARPAAECFLDADSRRYVGQLGGLIGDTLSGWRSHPGSAELSAIFADDGSLATLCFDSVAGKEVARRVPDVAVRARDLPTAPTCLAGHRLDFAWESEVATSEEVREAVRSCRREVSPLTRRIDWCRTAQHCSVEQVLGLESQAEREPA